ncbi:MAG: RHS repeat protein [Sphingomonadales bacterium]|nr:RHS repeat protein [Sphingomonadales bacterium]
METGAERISETDYSSADGLLQVTRNYRSRQRGGDPLSDGNIPGFGAHWHGLIPGRLIVATDFAAKVEYLSDDGHLDRFKLVGSTSNGANWTFETEGTSRRRISMVAIPATPRIAYFDSEAAVANGPGEVIMTLANGDAILFRRTGSIALGGQRTLVPVEQRFASGASLFYDYADTGLYPYRVRDSFGRELLLSWTNDKNIAAIALPDGTTLSYDYSEARGMDSVFRTNRLHAVQRKNAAGVALWGRSYLYEDARYPYALTGFLDLSGNRLSTITYGVSGLVESAEQAGGYNRYTVTHLIDAANRSNSYRDVTNPLGRTTRYTYYHPADGVTGTMPRRLMRMDGQATATVPADSKVYTYSKGPAGVYGIFVATGSTDERGTVTTITNDIPNRRPTAITEASGTSAARTTNIVWHATLDLPLEETRTGLKRTYAYTPTGQLTSLTETDTTTHTVPYATAGEARTTSYSWATNGRLLSVNGPLAPVSGVDDVTSFTYDTAGNLLTATNALGHVSSFGGYDASGRPGTMTDSNGAVTQFAYDALGRTASVTVKHPTNIALDAQTSFAYDAEGRVTAITAPDTAQLIMDYDLAGRLTAIRANDGERIDFASDAMGNVTSQTVKRADGSTASGITRTFDSIGRMLTETLGVGRTTAWSYDKLGNPTQIVSPRSNATTQAFDPLNRLITTVAPDTGTETTVYNKLDDVTSFTDPVAVTTAFVRNGFGEVIRETSPDRGTSTFYYDAAGRVTAAIDGRGQRVDYVRDMLGRVVSKTPLGLAAQAVSYQWDSDGLTGSAMIGRLGSVTDASGVTRFGWDTRGLLVAKEQSLGGTPAQLRYGYDKAGRITQITYPSGRIVTYTRDAKGRVSGIATQANAVAALAPLLSDGAYEPFGALKSASLGNGLVMEQDWGNDARLAGKTLRTSGGTALSHLTYAYDNDDNITGITDAVDATKSMAYAYDSNGRLSRVDTASGALRRTDYAHDKGGNRTSVAYRALPTDANPAASDTYTRTAGTNRLANITTPAGTRSISYDARGNTASETRPAGVSVSTSYDGYGRLTAYTRTGDPSQTNVYNGMDDRVAVTSGGTTHRYVYDSDGRVIGEYGTSAADVIAEFIWLNPEVGDGSAYGGDDGVGGYAPLAVASGPVATPTLLWVHGNHLGVPQVYTNASGAVTTPGAWQAPGFPGQSRTLADIYYNRYRDYDPSTGRYIQADPIGLAGDTNPYAYADGNPVTGLDPDGLMAQAVVGFFFGAGGELAIQGFDNWRRGRNVLDWHCYEWGEVATAGAMGAFGGNWVKGWVKLTQGSMKWSNASRRIRSAEGLVGQDVDLHHWLVPQRAFKRIDRVIGRGRAEHLFNRPWNLNKVPRSIHRRVLNPAGPLKTLARGAPQSVQGAAVTAVGAAAIDLSDGSFE